MKFEIYDVAVIGGGPGGYTAAMYCARSGYSVVVIEKLSAGGQMATAENVENYPGFFEGIDGFELGERMRKGAEKYGAVTVYGEVESANLVSSPKIVRTAEGEIEARAVILAMGARPRILGVPNERELTGRGVSYCAACDGRRYAGGTVAVIGGGNSAAGDVLTLSKICKKVYLIHRRDKLRAAKIYNAALKESGAEILWNTKVKEILGDKKAVGLKLDAPGGERILDVDAVFVAAGRTPDAAFLGGQAELDEYGYIKAGETTETSIEGVYAVGDVRTKPLRQIVTAAADGAVASFFVEKYLR